MVSTVYVQYFRASRVYEGIRSNLLTEILRSTTNTTRRTIVVLMLTQRPQRWPNINPTLGQCFAYLIDWKLAAILKVMLVCFHVVSLLHQGISTPLETSNPSKQFSATDCTHTNP